LHAVYHNVNNLLSAIKLRLDTWFELKVEEVEVVKCFGFELRKKKICNKKNDKVHE